MEGCTWEFQGSLKEGVEDHVCRDLATLHGQSVNLVGVDIAECGAEVDNLLDFCCCYA